MLTITVGMDSLLLCSRDETRISVSSLLKGHELGKVPSVGLEDPDFLEKIVKLIDLTGQRLSARPEAQR